MEIISSFGLRMKLVVVQKIEGKKKNLLKDNYTQDTQHNVSVVWFDKIIESVASPYKAYVFASKAKVHDMRVQ